MTSPLAHPDAERVFRNLLNVLGKESDRGMILVGAAHVDACLGQLMEAVFRPDLSKRAHRALMKYPGPFASFAAKADLAFAMRLIPPDVHAAIGALRKLRNDLAHGFDEFHLVGNEERYYQIYALGPNLPHGIRHLAFDMMTKYKVQYLRDHLKQAEGSPDAEDPDAIEREVMQMISDDNEVQAALEAQLPHWELAVGISLLAGLIIFHRERARAALDGVALIGNLRSAELAPTITGTDSESGSSA